ncbi:MAG: ABC transporter ATP-binding protein, partial [Herbaspirillum sp.]
RRKLKEIHQELKLSLIYVTHDQVEALTFADQVVVMTQGEVVQIGSAQQLFEEPAHTFVGYFIGNPGMNLLPCTIADGCAQINSASITLAPAAKAALGVIKPSDRVTLGIRPEFIEVLGRPDPDTQQINTLPAQLGRVRNMGTHMLAEFQLGTQTIAAKLHTPLMAGNDTSTGNNRTAWLRFPTQRTLYYVNDKRVA